MQSLFHNLKIPNLVIEAHYYLGLKKLKSSAQLVSSVNNSSCISGVVPPPYTHEALPCIPLCFVHRFGICYLKTWTDSQHLHIPDMGRQQHCKVLWGLCGYEEEEKATAVNWCVHSEIPFHPHTSLWVHILLILLCFPPQEGPFDLCDNPVFVPVISGSVMAQPQSIMSHVVFPSN